MARVLILGATGSLGLHVLRRALADGHDVTGFVRTPSKLPPEVRGRVSIHAGDLNVLVPLDLVKGEDAPINCAGHVGDGERFVALIDRLVAGADSLPVVNQPVCWFLASAALLDLDSAGCAPILNRRGSMIPSGCNQRG